MRMIVNVLLKIVALLAIPILLVTLVLIDLFLNLQQRCLTNLNAKGQNKKDGKRD